MASFCLPQRFLLFSGQHSFVPRDIFFCVYLLFYALSRLISPLKCFCPRSLPFVLLMFSLYFRCSFRFAYTVPFFFAIQDGVLLEVYGEMSSFWDETSRCFRNTVMGSDSLCERESLTARVAAGRRKPRKRAVNTLVCRTVEQG